MNNRKYQTAVEHLQFRESLYDDVAKKIETPVRKVGFLRHAAVAAMLTVVLATTAFAASPQLRAWVISQFPLGSGRIDLTNAQVMEFTVEDEIEGVTVHYMKLNGTDYLFANGMIYNSKPGLMRITEDYQLENVATQVYFGSLEKNDLRYRILLEYVRTEEGIVSRQKNVLQEDENGEVFLVLSDGNSNQWPAYVDLNTGVLRDALPGFTTDDFEGRVIYADQLDGGILISTIVNDGVVIDGNSVSYNMLYWIADGADTAIVIELPDDVWTWTCENNELHYISLDGYLYRLNDSFEFEQITHYRTGDDLTNGLLTAATAQNELVICDVLNRDQYIIKDLTVEPGKFDTSSGGRIGGDLDETVGYNAKRYGDDGRIALVQTRSNTESTRIKLMRIGILDPDTAQLRFVEVASDHWGYYNGWLDDDRFAVIYEGDEGDYLCIYEFE